MGASATVAQKYVDMGASVSKSFLTLGQFQALTRPKNPNKLSIYYYNDTHGNSDQMAEVAQCAKEFKRQSDKKDASVFVLSAGDNYSGGDSKKNEFIVNLMQNIMGVDASAVGNHEWDDGGEGFYEATEGKNVQFVATNVILDSNNPMNKVIKKSIIKEQNGEKYGFIGTMPIDFKACTKEENQKGVNVMGFKNTINALQGEIDNLRSQGVNKIILLSHIGAEADRELVQNLDGVDIVIGGHSHDVIKGATEGDNVLRSKSGEPVIITQAGENGKFYGILDVEFDDNGVIKNVSNNLKESTNMQKSPVIEYIKEQKLGASPTVGVLSEVDPLPPDRRIEPCGWTLTMADAMKTELDGDIAIINSANIRKVPQAGVLTERDVVESAPMKNKLIKTKLSQKQLVEAVQNAAKSSMNAPDSYPGLLQGSGFTYKIDDTGKLLEMNIVAKDGTITPVDIEDPEDDILYEAIYDTFTSKADGETPELAPRYEVQEFDFDKDKTMIDYLSKRADKDSLKIINDGRIQIIKTSQPKQRNTSSRSISD